MFKWDVVLTKGKNVGINPPNPKAEETRPVVVMESKDKPIGKTHSKVIVKKFKSIEDHNGRPTKQEALNRGDIKHINGRGTNLRRKSAVEIENYVVSKSDISSRGKVGSLKKKSDRKTAKRISYSKKGKSRRQREKVKFNIRSKRNYYRN